MAQNSETAHSLQLGELLDAQRQTASMTDIIVVCEEREFPAHKMILSATSAYFRAMFSPGWEERKRTRIELPTVGAKEMEIILSFMYTGKFENIHSQYLLKVVLAAVHSLQITTLFQCCYRRLIEGLNASNFLQITNLALLYNDIEMITHVGSVLAQHFEEITVSKEFINLNASQMLTIFQQPDIFNSSMDVAIKGLFRWTEVDKEREKTLLQILTTLDFQCMSTAFLTETLRKRTLVKRNYHILTLLTAEATSRTLTSTSKNLANPNEPKLLIFGKREHQQVFRIYDIKQNQWSLPKILPFPWDNDMCMVYFNGYMYVFGSKEKSGNSTTATVVKYCSTTNTVAAFGTLVVPVCCASAAVMYERVYVVSVLRSNTRVREVQRYNPATDTCEMVAETNNSHIVPCVLTFNKYLIVLGSRKDDNTVERYDPQCNTWTVLTSIPGAIDCCRATICKEKLFVVPMSGTSNFKTYSFSTGTWDPIQFIGPVIYRIYSMTLDQKCVLLVFESNGMMHAYDAESGQLIKKGKSAIRAGNIWKGCVV